VSGEVIAALLGALAAGLLQTITAIRSRKLEAEAVLTSIASEVDSICRLIRHQRYLEEIGKIADDIGKGMWNGVSYIIDVRENYFSVYEGLVTKLGLLRPHDASKIVNFYAYCKSAIDSTRVDGPHATNPKSNEAAGNMVSVAALLRSILTLGDEIVQMPKESIVGEHSNS
jgi:hypothetical protein